MSETITVTADCVAALARILYELEHETRAIVRALDSGGDEWAVVSISPTTDTVRSVFPCDRAGVRGDTRRPAQAGVMIRPGRAFPTVVIDRALRMHSENEGAGR